jgi:hypothetical protein
MEKGQLFQVAYNGNDNSYKSDVFMFHAEDDRIVLASKINLTTGVAEKHVYSFYRNQWNFFDVGPDIIRFINDRVRQNIKL